MGSIAHLIGRELTTEMYNKLSEAQRSELSEANYSLRRYGFGPFAAVFIDGSGIERKFKYTGHSKRKVEGAAHAAQRAVGIVQRMPGRIKSFEEALAFGGPSADKLEHLFQGLKNYGLKYADLGNMDHLLALDLKTTKIVIKNGRGQVVYKSAA